MPNINLISEQRNVKRERQRRTRTWFLAFVTVSVVGLMTVGYLTLKVESGRATIRSLQAKLEELAPYKDDITANLRKLAALKPRMDTLTKARMDTQRWWRILDHASLVMPPQTWLTSVRAQPSNDATTPTEIAWTGLSVEQNLIGELMLRLQACEDVADVQLKYTDQKKTSSGTGIEFQILCLVPGTEETAKPLAGKGESKT